MCVTLPPPICLFLQWFDSPVLDLQCAPTYVYVNISFTTAYPTQTYCLYSLIIGMDMGMCSYPHVLTNI